MLPVKVISRILPCGVFGSERKYDIHTGIDLYATQGEPVIACVSGEVKKIFQFTGSCVQSPWWRDTYAVLIGTPQYDILFGELLPTCKEGDVVTKDSVIGFVEQVLKTDKGKTPLSMLHLEIWEKDSFTPHHIWQLGKERPKGLLDPANSFPVVWVIKTENGYRLESFGGNCLKFFSMPADCKSYCMHYYSNCSFNYLSEKVDSFLIEQYKNITGKNIYFRDFENDY